MKTYKEWSAQKKDFINFVKPGDEIDSEMFNYFLGVVPPRQMISSGFLCGEPYSHDTETGLALYEAFYESPGGKYYFGGLKTVREFTDSRKREYTLRKCCRTCDGHNRPGWIINSSRWTRCPECNQKK